MSISSTVRCYSEKVSQLYPSFQGLGSIIALLNISRSGGGAQGKNKGSALGYMVRFSAKYLLLLGIILVTTSLVQAQERFETSFNGKTVYCEVSDNGNIVSGKIKKGVFKKDRKIKKLRKKVKNARKAGDTLRVKRTKRELRKVKARLESCTRGYIPDEDPESPPEDPGTPPSGDPFSQAFFVLQTHCASCHLNQHAAWRDLQTQASWLEAQSVSGEKLINEDDLANSLLLKRIRFYGAPNSSMPLPNLNATQAFTVNEYGLIHDWILSLGSSSEPLPPPEEPSGNELTSAELFQCSGSPVPSEARVRRIDNMEWAATLGLRGTDARFNPLVADSNHQYSTFSKGETLNATVLAEYLNYLSHTRTGWVIGSTSSGVPRPPEHRCMIEVPPPNTACITNFLRVYLKNFVLFQQPTSPELSRLVAFAEDAVANGDRTTDAGRSLVMEQITSAAWLSASALFRSERGRGDSVGDGVAMLSNEELGKALAYTLTDQGPGAPKKMQTARVYPAFPRIQAIEDAVDNGTISSPATLDALVAANYAGVDPDRAPQYSEYWLSEKIERFFMEWLGLESLPTSFHDTPSATADVTGFQHVDLSYNHMKKPAYYGNEIMLSEQAIEMIAKIVDNDEQVIRNLFTSREFYLPSNLSSSFAATASPQAVYNWRADIAGNRQARWNTLPSDERAGILTHPAWLAAHADNFENGPSAVLRGKWIRENVLCGIVPDVPITVDASFPPSTAHLSARERLAQATGDTYCQTCHSLMNPLGLPFEKYNHAGFLRATDHGAPPSGASTIVFSGDPSLDGEVADAVEFSERLADSPVVEQCFIRQVFRYFMGRNETAEDSCTLVMMQNAYQQSNGSMRTMLQTLIKSPTFTMRKLSAQEE